MASWTPQQREVVNTLTIPMTEFVNDIVNAHEEHIKSTKEELEKTQEKLQLKINKLKESYSNRISNLKLQIHKSNCQLNKDVITSLKSEFQELQNVNEELGSFIIDVSRNRHSSSI